MEGFFVLLALIAGALVIGGPIAGFVALSRGSELRRRLDNAERDLALLRAIVAAAAPTAVVRTETGSPQAEAVAPPEPQSPAVQAPEAAVDAQSAPGSPWAPPPQATPVQAPPPGLIIEGDAVAPAPPPDVPPSTPPRSFDLEQLFGMKGLLWIGGLAVALSAVFLVRYSIEQGWLSPFVRCTLGALLGAALIAGGERMRSRDPLVAQALVASGVVALFAALFAAASLYELLPPLVGGVLAAMIAVIALALSLRHGPFVALLGFVGGAVAPALVRGDPNMPLLFAYQLALTVGMLAVVRVRGWWWLAWFTLAAAVVWVLAWCAWAQGRQTLVGSWELLAPGLYLVGLAAAVVWATWRRAQQGDARNDQIVLQAWITLGVVGLLLGATMIVANHAPVSGWLCLVLYGAGLFVLARWTPRFQYVAVAPVLVSLAVLAHWGGLGGYETFVDLKDAFAWRAGAMGALSAVGAYALLWNAGRPGFWGGLSVAAASGHFLVTWWALRGELPPTGWAALALALAVPYLVAVERLMRWRDRMTGATEALAYLAAGAIFFIAAATAIRLEREWMTIAYAVELAALATLSNRLSVPSLRVFCWPLLALVVARLGFNPFVLDYPLPATPILNWMLYAYGASIAALWWAGRELRAMRVDPLVAAVEAACALLAFVFLTLQVRAAFHGGDMTAPELRWFEAASYVLVWGGFSTAALWAAIRGLSPVAIWAWRLAASLALVLSVGGMCLVLNPAFDRIDIGAWPVFNGLLLGYAAPAALALAILFLVRRTPDREPVAMVAALAALLLAFAWATLEVRHFYHPTFGGDPFAARGQELYAYSAAWLAFGGAMFALGIWRRAPEPRLAGMALLALTVVKVFLVDMANLGGLLRVFSFLGLGLALIGLGYLYRRFVGGVGAPPPAPPPAGG